MVGIVNMSIVRNVLLSIVGLVAGPAWSQGLADPTRPPAALAADPGPTAPTTGLQFILRRQGMKPAAVINGALVELGGRVGDACLVAVNEDSVVLQSDTGRDVLRLTPGAEKKPVQRRENTADRQTSRDRPGTGGAEERTGTK